MAAPRISALTRLRDLPAIFRGSDLTLRFGWSSKTASQYIYLWRRAQIVEPFGGHSDVYANTIVDPSPDWERALAMAMPSAVVVGVECLRRVGWITQIPATTAVAVHAASVVYSTAHFAVERRSATWFETIQPGLVRGQAGRAPSLHPAYALADLIAREGWGRCGLDRDDIDVDALTAGDRARLRRAMHAFALEEDACA